MQENKMGTMPVPKLLFTMSIPMVISMLVQALYNVVDSVFVAKLSEDALNAVSLAFPVQNLMISVAVGTGVGINALLSKSLGEKRQERANATAMNGLFLAVISFLAFVLLGLTCSRVFFLMQTDQQTIVDYGAAYMTIVSVLSGGIFLQITFDRVLQATGRTVYTLFTQAVGAIINIILDPILIFAFGMGVEGAALATIISQALSCIWVLAFLFGKKTRLRIRTGNMRLRRNVILPCLALGLSTFIMQASESIISICFNSSLLKYGGDIAVGAMTILTSVMQFAMLPLQGLGQGAQPIISYNYGAKNVERVKSAYKLLLKCSMTYAGLLWAGVMLFPRSFASLFTSEAELLVFAGSALRVYAACLFLFGIQMACQMTFTSLGNAKASIVVAVVRKFVLLIPLIFLLPQIFPEDKTMAVYLAEPVADFIAVAFTAVLFAFQFKKALREISE